jgi:thiol-disulfide isomerase/thioredoxin
MSMQKTILGALLAVLTFGNFAGTGEGELRPFVRGSWKQILAAHAGRATVVHFWGLTCGPCRTEMPQWGKLLAERSDLDLVVIEADLVTNETSAVQSALTQAGLGAAENWIFSDKFIERLQYEIDPQWRGEIPRTVLIARDGSTTLIEGIFDPYQIRTWLDKLATAKCNT